MILIALFLAGVLTAGPLHADSCLQSVAREGFWVADSQLIFDLQEFSSLKTRYTSELNAGIAPSADRSRESILALLEAKATHQGLSLGTIEEVLTRGSTAKRRALAKALQGIQPDSALTSPWVLAKINGTLYRALHVREAPLYRRWLGPSADETVRSRLETAITRQNLMDAYQDLGMLGRDSDRQAFARWREAHRNTENILISGAVNAIWLKLAGVPGSVPAFDVLAHKPIPQSLIDLIKAKGFDAAQPEIQAFFGNLPGIDRALRAASTVYSKAMLAYGGYFLVQHFSAIRTAVAMDFVSDDDVKRLEDVTFDADKIRQEQFLSWKEGFKAFEGHYPDLANPAEKTQADEEWARLKAIPDERLRVGKPTTP